MLSRNRAPAFALVSLTTSASLSYILTRRGFVDEDSNVEERERQQYQEQQQQRRRRRLLRDDGALRRSRREDDRAPTVHDRWVSLHDPLWSWSWSWSWCAETKRTTAAACERADGDATTTVVASRAPATPAPPSRLRRLLRLATFRPPPLPRPLRPNDPAFSYPALARGLRRRAEDETRLRALEREAVEARASGDPKRIAEVVARVSDAAYGEGVTPQARQDFLVKYGCTAHTPEILSLLCDLGTEHGHRGIVEIGAGNGQWARALTDHYRRRLAEEEDERARRDPRFEFVLAHDDGSSLPLSPEIYHARTAPARDFFYPRVRRCENVARPLRAWEARGRVLLLVFPPPGPMAVEAAREYARTDPERNDVVVYVGEGRGGCNADEDFFSFWETTNDENDNDDRVWVLERVLDVGEGVGNKGFEKCFVFRRVLKDAFR